MRREGKVTFGARKMAPQTVALGKGMNTRCTVSPTHSKKGVEWPCLLSQGASGRRYTCCRCSSCRERSSGTRLHHGIMRKWHKAAHQLGGQPRDMAPWGNSGCSRAFNGISRQRHSASEVSCFLCFPGIRTKWSCDGKRKKDSLAETSVGQTEFQAAEAAEWLPVPPHWIRLWFPLGLAVYLDWQWLFRVPNACALRTLNGEAEVLTRRTFCM